MDVLHTLARPKSSGNEEALSSPLSLSMLPTLCCAAAGGTLQVSEGVTQAWTLLYAALHILDSIEDEDAVDKSWAHWGKGPAINLSTGLIASTGSLLCTLEQAEIPPDAAQHIRRQFFHVLLHMTAGQHADLTLHEPTLEQCWQIAAAKSGAWFGLACHAGARIVTEDARQLEHFQRFGHHLGMLVQIGDDIDGLWVRDGAQSDLTNWPRWTLPVAYAMLVLDGSQRDQLYKYIRAASTDPDAEEKARSLTIRSGAVLYLIVEAHQHYNQAYQALLAAAEASTARDELLAVLRMRLPATTPN
jgi:geranylgeranyl pyrophosphate synthase